MTLAAVVSKVIFLLLSRSILLLLVYVGIFHLDLTLWRSIE